MSELRPSLREMVVRWTQIVADVERGYTLTFDDYLNDLDLRRQIDARLWELELGEIKVDAGLREALGKVDERFRNVTIVSEQNVWGEENARDEGWDAESEWYYYRMPVRLPTEW
ncbi:MAG: hypothetical protein ABJC26_17970 [Gemmatimonadaceae bacterium]